MTGESPHRICRRGSCSLNSAIQGTFLTAGREKDLLRLDERRRVISVVALGCCDRLINSQEGGRQILLDDAKSCFGRRIAANQVETSCSCGIEQQGSNVV